MNENEIIEEWLPICGYEGLYEVSNMGQVKSLKFGKEKILSQFDNGNGYLAVNLCKDGKMKSFLVHRLVATAFLENPNGYRCVNHKDECKTNNCADNLEWCTQKYNLNYKNAQAKRVASRDYKELAEKLSRQVYQYDKNGTLVGIYPSVAECERNGFHHGNVSSCCLGKRKSHQGYIWSYTPL